MKILLVQTSFLGDTILSTPLIAGIKKLYPESELWMMTTKLSSGVVEKDPLLKGVIAYDKGGREKGLSQFFQKVKELRTHKFDMVFAVQRSYRTSLLLFLAGIAKRVGYKQARLSFLYNERVFRPKEPHDVIRNLSLLSNEAAFKSSGQKVEDFYPTDLRLFHDNPQGIKEKFPEIFAAQKEFCVLVPGSAWKTKMWDWRGFKDVAEYLMSQDKTVVLVGAPAEAELCQRIADGTAILNLAGKTSIADTIGIIKEAALLVCNDSMSLHMASALKVPNVSVFCATSPTFGFGPWKNNALVVEKEGLYCKPCRRHGSNTCPTGTEACMKDLPASEVIKAIGQLAGR